LEGELNLRASVPDSLKQLSERVLVMAFEEPRKLRPADAAERVVPPVFGAAPGGLCASKGRLALHSLSGSERFYLDVWG